MFNIERLVIKISYNYLKKEMSIIKSLVNEKVNF